MNLEYGCQLSLGDIPEMPEDWVDCRRGAVLDPCLAWCASLPERPPDGLPASQAVQPVLEARVSNSEIHPIAHTGRANATKSH